MHNQDYAILVGMPSEQPTPEENSRIANDIAAVRAWMLDPGGGALRPDRLRCIMPGAGWQRRPGARPPLAQLHQAVAELEAQARARQALAGSPRIGRRLYLYFAGQACLPGWARLGSAGRLAAPRLASAWQVWAQGSDLFRELALWFDTNPAATQALGWREPMPARPGSSGPASIALAARGPQQAALVYPAEAGGRGHGAFTWALLEGLRGAAADASGRVTATSLADWLRHAQAARTDAASSATEAREPEIVAADPALVLAEGVGPAGTAVAWLPGTAGSLPRAGPRERDAGAAARALSGGGAGRGAAPRLRRRRTGRGGGDRSRPPGAERRRRQPGAAQGGGPGAGGAAGGGQRWL
jgi:hypothetical protein